jgi:DNA replication and repair protein RecF
MKLEQLDIHHLRNITQARLTLHPKCTVVYGDNGSGKTSLLEAIYLLGTGHSFRTRDITPLIQSDERELTVFARTLTVETVSVQKTSTGLTRVQINHQSCKSSSELAYFLPCQIFYQDIFNIIDAGPSVRRNVLDWGMFHVKHEYLPIWKDYKRVLKHRNALLRQKAKKEVLLPWNNQLVELSNHLHDMRSTYVKEWMRYFYQITTALTSTPVEVTYYKGWDKKQSDKSLQDILEEQYESDLYRQYTQSGAHQADIVFKTTIPGSAKQSYSRGQQKIILIALKLAQAKLINKPCIYLFDDVAAEFDGEHLKRLFDYLKQIEGQFVFTTTDINKLPIENPPRDYRVIEVKNGCFEQL